MQNDQVSYYPFFHISSKLLKDMLGVKDTRSVIKRMQDLGVEVYTKGKNKYVITADIIQALQREEHHSSGYKGKSKLAL